MLRTWGKEEKEKGRYGGTKGAKGVGSVEVSIFGFPMALSNEILSS